MYGSAGRDCDGVTDFSCCCPRKLLLNPVNESVIFAHSSDSGHVHQLHLRSGKASKLPIENVRAVSLNGRTLVLGTSLGSVVVWDLGTKDVLCKLVGDIGAITSVCVSEDHIYASNDDGKIVVWDRNDKSSTVTSCATLIGHKGKVNSMAVQVRAYPSAELLYSASDDNTIRQWDSKSGQCMTVMRGHLGSVLELRTNATLVASSSADGSVCLWKPQSSQPAHSIEAGGLVTNLELTEKELFVSAGNLVTLFALPACTSHMSFTGHMGRVQAFSLWHHQLFSASRDGSVRKWDTETGKYEVLDCCSSACAVIAGPQWCVAANDDGKIRRWRLASGVDSPLIQRVSKTDTRSRSSTHDGVLDSSIISLENESDTDDYGQSASDVSPISKDHLAAVRSVAVQITNIGEQFSRGPSRPGTGSVEQPNAPPCTPSSVSSVGKESRIAEMLQKANWASVKEAPETSVSPPILAPPSNSPAAYNVNVNPFTADQLTSALGKEMSAKRRKNKTNQERPLRRSKSDITSFPHNAEQKPL